MSRSNNFVTGRLVSHLALIPPPCRMLMLFVFADREDGDSPWVVTHKAYPIVGIESVREHVYRRRRRPDDGVWEEVPPTGRERRSESWTYSRTDAERRFLFVEGDAEIWDANEYIHHCIYNAHRVVSCEWPTHADAERLGPIVESMREDAIRDQTSRDRSAAYEASHPEGIAS